MANYYESARTNYFRVKDVAAFIAFIETVPGCEHHASFNNPDQFCVLFTDETVPNSRYNEETQDYDEFDFMDELAPHLADGSIAVLQASGHEKLRYITGYAIAIDNTGKSVSVNIDNIYDLAKKKFGKEAEITQAHY
jgi:hypothetical protein